MHHRASLTARPNTCGRLSMSGRERKRTRSWEVDVSLEELVSWDVLDQFMGDMPSEPVQPERRVGPEPRAGVDADASEPSAARVAASADGARVRRQQ